MMKTNGREWRMRGVSMLRVAAAMVFVYLYTGTTNADDNPPKAAPQAKAAVGQQAAASAEAPRAQTTQPANQPARRPIIAPRQSQRRTTTARTKSGCSDKGKPELPTPSAEGPQPRWMCKEQTVTSEPVWSGKNAEFVFEIANEGEADLDIKLKGG